MKKSKRTAHLNILFYDMDVVQTNEAIDTIKSVMLEMQEQFREEVERSLSDIGAKEIELSITVY